MGLIVALFASILCLVLYIKMCKREQPSPMEKKKAALPVVLGVIAPILSTIVVILFGLAATKIKGGSLHELPVVLRSFIGSFILAGFTEEFIKFLLLLLAVKLVKPKNVYEFGILGAGIGFGFTGLEDALYGNGSAAVALSRIPTFALHMVFGIIMGLHFGLAKYSEQNNSVKARIHKILAMLVPVFWHTIFDASTASNFALQSENEDTQILGAIVGLVVVLISIVLQFMTLGKFKKKSEEYCGMEIG